MDAALDTRRPAAPPSSPLTAAACAPAEEVLTGRAAYFSSAEAGRSGAP
jgi:hypothetical protein